MRRCIAVAGLSVALCWVALGQNAPTPAFDIADVHLTPRGELQKKDIRMDGGVLGSDRYAIRRATMLDLIWLAYSVRGDKVFGGPHWLGYNRYDIVAKTKPGTRPATLRLMLQNLLAERFHLALKTEMQPVPGFLLTKKKSTPNMTAAAETAEPGACQQIQEGDPRLVHSRCRNMTMDDFAAYLNGPARPVENVSGLEGSWDFELFVTMGNLATGSGSTQADAIEKLGLKLEPAQVPRPVLTVASADEIPTANPPGIAEALPPLPTPEFEAASVRLCGENSGGGSRPPAFQPGGRITANCSPPGGLIRTAWDLPELPAGLPKSFQSGTGSNISIVAKAPSGVPPDKDSLNAMMRSLLADRYKMTFHFENRPMDTFTLVAVKPKLAKADPTGRTACTGHSEGGNAREGWVDRLECVNMTMTQFAEQISSIGGGAYIYPVLDATGISGAWDFVLNYRRGGLRPAANASGELADPTGTVSFEDAIQTQLGLKLEKHKRPEPVFVIDHMEEKPTDN